jgi:hypothetical protein
MAEQQTDTYRNLIKAAEEKAVEASDINKFSFVDYLENGGVIMPTDQVTIFTDSRASAKIMTLHRRHDELKAAATKAAEQTLEDARNKRFNELLEAAQEVGEPLWQGSLFEQPEEDNEYTGMADEEPAVLPSQKEYFAQLWSQVFLELPNPTPTDVPETEALLAELNELEQQVWESRMILDLEGMQPGAQRDMEEQIAEELSKKFQSALPDAQRQEYAATRRADEIVAACVTRIQIPRKAIDQDFSKERMPAYVARRMLRPLETSQVEKLMLVAQTLTFAAAIVEPTVDAGFPGGSADAAGRG